ncbi:MAG: fibronectin type III domain-containing protein [Bacteroidales bacterium]|nr:fibronectin type III domain-containing protein [Bacteroidales bacterium]
MKTFKWFIAGIFLLLPLLHGCKAEKPELPVINLNPPVLSGVLEDGIIVLSWAPVTNAISYKVEIKDADASEYKTIGSPSYAPFSVPEIETLVGHTYDLRVKAINGDSESDWSNVVTLEVIRLLPLPVIRCDADFTSINVEWSAVEGASSYSVEHKVSVASDWTVDYTGNETSFRISELDSGVSYDVRVGAVADGFSMTYSDVVTMSTAEAPSTFISSGEQLATWLAGISVETTEVAALANDIDMQGITITPASGFAGTLEGQGHSIKNLTSSVPLFAQNSGTIKALVLDESCSFTAESNVFGPLVGRSIGGAYKNVVNKASVTYGATADVDVEIVLGGLVGLVEGARFENCSNEGNISFNAPGCVHKNASLGGLAGLVNNNEGGSSVFFACVNSGKVSLNAKYGDPVNDFSGTGTNNAIGINLGGIVGTSSLSNENNVSFEQCVNETGAVISLYHSDMVPLPTKTDGSSGPVSVAGILGFGQGRFNQCSNLGLIKAVSLAEGDPSEAEMKKKNYLLKVGGIAGMPWDDLAIESCTNSGNIEVEYYGLYDNDDKWRAAVGGICAQGAYNSTGTYVQGCTVDGNITVSGKGTVGVGGVIGVIGKQVNNTVTANCHITVNGRKGDVGGLVGYVVGGAANYTIKGCSCAATIFADSDWGPYDKTWYYSIGGLMGRWSGANGEGSNASMTGGCVFSGSISSIYQTRVGIIVGAVRGNKKVVFGESNNPIRVSGKFSRKDVEELTINSENLETYQCGYIQEENTTTMHVVCE